jgi:Ca2+/Na+ antiporter
VVVAELAAAVKIMHLVLAEVEQQGKDLAEALVGQAELTQAAVAAVALVAQELAVHLRQLVVMEGRLYLVQLQELLLLVLAVVVVQVMAEHKVQVVAVGQQMEHQQQDQLQQERLQILDLAAVELAQITLVAQVDLVL